MTDQVVSRTQAGGNQWVREEEWYVWREPTTRPFPHIRMDATRMLFRGLTSMAAISEWKGEVLHVQSLGCQGTTSLEGGYLTTKIRFDAWAPARFIPFLQDKILAELAAATVETAGGSFFGKDVFLIHGHDDRARNDLKGLIESLGLNPIVLAEKDDGGMTIIEKFEYHAKACSFAFALMTPDDIKAGHVATEQIWQARPNVILEMGWFMARLGRTRVMMLLKGEIEIPSDLQGILYQRFDQSVTEVSTQVNRRLREAGLV